MSSRLFKLLHAFGKYEEDASAVFERPREIHTLGLTSVNIICSLLTCLCVFIRIICLVLAWDSIKTHWLASKRGGSRERRENIVVGEAEWSQ